MKNLSVFLKFSVVMIAITILVTCSSDNPTEPEDGGNNGNVVTPSTTSGMSMSWVALSGLPANSNGYYGIVTTIDKAIDTGFAPIVRADTGDFMIMPLYPTGPSNSGEVQIVFTDGANYVSDPITFSIDSLPAAPGELAAIVSLLQDILTDHLRLAGLTRDSLIYQIPADAPLSRLPLILAYGAIDDPTNPNSLRALVDGTIPILNGRTLNLDFVERILAETGIRAYFEELATVLDSTTIQFTASTKSDWHNIKVNASQACIAAPSYGISTCGQLAAAMNHQYNNETASNSAGDKVINDGISAGLMIASLFPGVAVEAAATGSVVWGDDVLNKGQQNMLPSEFADGATSFNPSETKFKEDFTTDGNWTEFMVTATSKGWILDKIAIEAVLQTLGAAKLSNGPPGLTDDVSGALGDMVKGQAQSQIMEEYADAAGLIEICPNTWSNINCAGISYSDVVPNNDKLEIDSVALTYKPKEVGSTVMRIETKNIFGQSNNTGTAASISTDELVVVISPSFLVESDTNKTINFSSDVTNAEDKKVLYTLNGGGTMSSDNSTANVTTPMNPWDPPLVLHAKSLANTGLRKDKVDSDPRVDSVLIKYKGEGQFAISPETICLQPNQSQNYSILVISGSVDSVRWYTEPENIGTIFTQGNNMVYTAPETQEGLISLFAIVNGKDTAEASIDISDCACYWEINAPDGFHQGLMSIVGLDAGFQMLLSPAKYDAGPPHVSVILAQFNGLGTYDNVNVIYTDPGTSPMDLHIWTSMDTAVAPPTMTITEYVPNDYMIGIIRGEINQFIIGTDPLQYRRFNLSLPFRAEIAGGINETICEGDSL